MWQSAICSGVFFGEIRKTVWSCDDRKVQCCGLMSPRRHDDFQPGEFYFLQAEKYLSHTPKEGDRLLRWLTNEVTDLLPSCVVDVDGHFNKGLCMMARWMGYVPRKRQSRSANNINPGLDTFVKPIYATLSHLVVSACRSILPLAVCRLVADIKWKYPNNLNS